MRTKKALSILISTVTFFTFFCVHASADVRVDSLTISNCLTSSYFKYTDAFTLLKNCSIFIEGEEIYAGDMYGLLDDGILSDKVQCKVASDVFPHYALVVTKKGSSVSEDIYSDAAAYTAKVTLGSDKGATFYGGFIFK